MTGSDFSAVISPGMAFFKTLFVLLCVLVPLGVWKLVEIIFWLCRHIHVHIQ